MHNPVTTALDPAGVPPELDTDEKLRAAGWAAGVDVLTEMYDAYADLISDGTVARAQLRSMVLAIRAHRPEAAA